MKFLIEDCNQHAPTFSALDIGYCQTYPEQLNVAAYANGVLNVLLGCGPSKNARNAVKVDNHIELTMYAILRFKVVQCTMIVQQSAHFEIKDMHIAEDLQPEVGHLCIQGLSLKPLDGGVI